MSKSGVCTMCQKFGIFYRGNRCKPCKNKAERDRRNKNRKHHNQKEKEYYHNKKLRMATFKPINIPKDKLCTICNTQKSISEFYFHKAKCKYRAECKVCASAYRKTHYNNNRTKIIKQTTAYQLNRVKCDPAYKIEKNMRCRLYHAIVKKGACKSNNTMKLVGCTRVYLKKYLENMFIEDMSWDNYGSSETKCWHIDHIKPCASFDLSDPNQQIMCFHYTNLQPLWGPDNLSKSNKFDEKNFNKVWDDEKGWVEN